MKVKNIANYLDGFLWEAIDNLDKTEYIEPEDDLFIGETVLGPMNELELALFTLKFTLFTNILPFLKVNEDIASEIEEFYYWLVGSTKVEFLEKYIEINIDDEIESDQEVVLIFRSQFLAAHDFLDMVTCQRFALDPEDSLISYRKGNLVALADKKIFCISEN